MRLSRGGSVEGGKTFNTTSGGKPDENPRVKNDFLCPKLPVGLVAFVLILFSVPARSFAENVVNPDAHASQPAPENKMLQFSEGGHVVGFDKTRMIMAGGSHAFSVEFINATGAGPVSNAPPLKSAKKEQYDGRLLCLRL